MKERTIILEHKPEEMFNLIRDQIMQDSNRYRILEASDCKEGIKELINTRKKKKNHLLNIKAENPEEEQSL